MGILATGLPLALQNFGPWFGMNAVLVAGLFGVPRFLAPERAGPVKLLAIGAGPVLFLYAHYGGAVPAVPDPVSVLGPVATFTLIPGRQSGCFGRSTASSSARSPWEG